MSPALARQEEQNKVSCHSWMPPIPGKGNREIIDFLKKIKAREPPKLRYNSNQPAWTGL
jgi:uncharacterized protein YggU (UPF0235/DUF167 family)